MQRANVALVCAGCARPVELILGAPLTGDRKRVRTPSLSVSLSDHAAASPQCGGSQVRVHLAPADPSAYGQLMHQVAAYEGRR